jgi:hypothetical protein
VIWGKKKGEKGEKGQGVIWRIGNGVIRFFNFLSNLCNRFDFTGFNELDRF